MKNRKVYLAGPQVFQKNTKEIGERMKKACMALGLVAFYPGDCEIPRGNLCEERRIAAKKIYNHCIEGIVESEFFIGDISPFRGVSADPGTVFEIGYARSLGKKIFLYSDTVVGYFTRVQDKLCGGEADLHYEDGKLIDVRDRNGLLIEDFCLTENLMIAAWPDKIYNSFEDALLYGVGQCLV